MVHPVGLHPLAAWIADGERLPRPDSGKHQVAQLGLVQRGADHHVRYAAQVCQVEKAVVRRPVLPHQTGTVDAEDDRKPLQRDIVDNLVVGTLQEC